jgi:hypothetical protein
LFGLPNTATRIAKAMEEKMMILTTSFQPKRLFGAAVAFIGSTLALVAMGSALAECSVVLVDLGCRAISPGVPQPGQTAAVSLIVWSQAEHW